MRRSSRSPTRASAAAALLALTLGTGAALAADGSPSAVLVHGAWMDASARDRVIAALGEPDVDAVAVDLPGHGDDATEAPSLQDYVDAVVAALPAEGEAVLVGHSVGGMVVSAVTEAAPGRVSRLVYVAGYLLRDGESLYGLSQTDADSHVGRYWRQDDPAAYTPASIAPEGIVGPFCADRDESDRAMPVATHRAEPVPPLGTPVSLSAEGFGGVPITYVRTLADHALSPALQDRMIEARSDVDTVDLDTSHLPMLTMPEALVDVIAAAVAEGP